MRLNPIPAFLILAIIVASQSSACAVNTIFAKEIITQAKNGESINYNNAVIVGDLKLESVNENRSYSRKENRDNKINFPIIIINSKILGNIFFGNSTFQKPVDFRNTTFQGQVHFENSCFNDDAMFANSKFDNNANFEGARFHDIAQFDNAYFNKAANFNGCKFLKSAYFCRSKFDDSTKFRSSNFNGDTDFESARFEDDTAFNYANFTGETSFSNVSLKKYSNFAASQFWDTVEFLYANFYNKTTFKDSAFDENANFSGSIFWGMSDFSNVHFRGKSFFDEINFEKNIKFNDAKFDEDVTFNSSKFMDDALFANVSFKKMIYLVNAKYDSIYIKYSEISNLFYNEASYLLLIENFNKLGFYEDGDACYYQFRVEQFLRRNPLNNPIGYIIDLGAWTFYGFGKRVDHTLIWSFFVLIISGILFYGVGGIKESIALNVPRHENNLWPLQTQCKKVLRQEKPISLGECLLCSAIYFTSGASNVISSQPNEFYPTGKSRYIAVLERILGWFFFALFLSTLGNMIIR